MFNIEVLDVHTKTFTIEITGGAKVTANGLNEVRDAMSHYFMVFNPREHHVTKCPLCRYMKERRNEVTLIKVKR